MSSWWWRLHPGRGDRPNYLNFQKFCLPKWLSTLRFTSWSRYRVPLRQVCCARSSFYRNWQCSMAAWISGFKIWWCVQWGREFRLIKDPPNYSTSPEQKKFNTLPETNSKYPWTSMEDELFFGIRDPNSLFCRGYLLRFRVRVFSWIVQSSQWWSIFVWEMFSIPFHCPRGENLKYPPWN